MEQSPGSLRSASYLTSFKALTHIRQSGRTVVYYKLSLYSFYGTVYQDFVV